jgi:HIV Tat-specific factor 1
VTRQQLKKKRKNGDEVRGSLSINHVLFFRGGVHHSFLTRNYLLQENAQKPKRARVNTAVYVTSIPLDVTLEEINDLFSKCGVIAEEIDSGRPRIKMYTDEEGQFKGEALVVYFRPESVNLAIQMLDETDFRLGVAGAHGPMRVQAADFSFKSQQEAPAKSSARDKKKIIKRTQKLNK